MRTLLASVIIVALVIVSHGCKGGSSASGKPRVALVMKSLANDFFRTMQEGAEKHFKAHSADYELLTNGIRDEEDVAGQVAVIEQMIAQRVDAIVMTPANSKGLVPVLKRAMDAGIVVVNIDNKLDDDVLASMKLKIPFVGPDNRKGAKLVGDYMAKKLNAGDEVAIIEGMPGAYNSIQRTAGFNDTINEFKLKLVTSQSGRWEAVPAEKVASGIVIQNPNLKAIFCANDNMALGALASLKNAGKLKTVLVCGYDNTPAIQERLRDGSVVATIDQHSDQMAVFGIEAALEILKKKSTPQDKQTPVDLITPQSLKK